MATQLMSPASFLNGSSKEEKAKENLLSGRSYKVFKNNTLL